MRVPIAHCLGFPDRLAAPTPRLDFAKIATLTVEAPDFDRFPALRLALDALAQGGGLTTVLNAANEIAVEAFLARRIAFSGIAHHVEGYAKEPSTIDEALDVDRLVRECSRKKLAIVDPAFESTIH
jgi:1-deoxy-D-xylulose-5-phosphate reductoisomerase